ncbi:hypothetical protein GCM10009641_50920 [Mycobacterium cookii]|uniref:DUF732 domain-containing protein n=2 Tax=Mycobacterium cookii TaxID=1775 RepID=A0A7I7KUB3_9MYCO|nr:hypothetical protein MCOO_17250 [Mycobacterium cookii]
MRSPLRGRTGADDRRTMMDAAVAVSTRALRPVIVTAAVFAAATGVSPHAHADSVGDAMAPVLNSAGIGNNGPVSGAIAQVGQSICPMLVQPGSGLASSAAQISGNGGLAPPLAGFLVGMAIQSQCPSFMTSVANGDMPFPIPGAPGAAPAGLPFGPPAPSPLQLPGF